MRTEWGHDALPLHPEIALSRCGHARFALRMIFVFAMMFETCMHAVVALGLDTEVRS